MSDVGALDRLLFSDAAVSDFEALLRDISVQQLWPGLRRPEEMPTYLKGVTGDAADLVAASLLLVLHRDPTALDQAAWRPLAADLLRVRLDRLQPHVAAPDERGSHAIFAVCAGAVSAVEADYRAQVANFSDLKQISELKNALFRRLNGRAGSLLLRPFVPRATVDSALGRLFDAAQALTEADSERRDGAYAALAEAAEACHQATSAAGTHFAKLTVADVADAMSSVATREVELSRPPALIRVSVDSRPLPLREAGITCDLLLEVENDSNVGARNVVVTSTAADSVTFANGEATLDRLDAGASVPLAFAMTILEPVDRLDCSVELSWRNPDQTRGKDVSVVSVAAQAGNVDWEAASSIEPYAPYPVEDADALVGRNQILNRLELQFSALPLPNLYVTGQRRVGKTSLVRVLGRQLRRRNDQLVVASVEMGEVRQDVGRETITKLGEVLARKLIRGANAKDLVEVPTFDGSLAPLNEIVDELRDLDDGLSFMLVIDEFDELPDEMFRRGGPGDALFLPMRSLAQKPFVGWILVGGERMPYIRDEQATRLNTFSAIQVDYLEFVERDAVGDDEAGNFASLVRMPLPAGFEVADEAIGNIHAATLGNPHFAKSLCAELYRSAVARRDSVILQRHVEAAVNSLASQSEVELFAHFWEDGIFNNDGADRRRVELERRYVLAAAAEVRRTGRAEVDRIEAAAERHGVSRATAKRTMNDLLRRGVLVEGAGKVSAKVPLFGAWLEDEGAYQLTPKGIAEQAEEEIRAADRSAAVGTSEVGRLVQRWRSFKFRGESITRDDVSQWLEQFDSAVERRLMFRLLERFRTISDAEMLEGLRRLNRLISHEGRIELAKGQRTLAHVLVAGVGVAGASGQAMAYKYRQANNVRQRNVVSMDQICARVEADHEVRAIVLVDDFIGSGKTVIKELKQLAGLDREDLQVFAFAVSGITEGVQRLEHDKQARALRLRVEVAHPLTAAHRPFDSQSTVFANDSDQAKAEEVVRHYGKELVPSMPLGYGGQAVLLTLPDNCPNNAPPIFWSDTNGWRPLFPRTAR